MTEADDDEPGEPAVEVRAEADGVRVLVDGEVRATFVGDLHVPSDRAAFEEMLDELFGSGRKSPLVP
jgi:hypothetical protein